MLLEVQNMAVSTSHDHILEDLYVFSGGTNGLDIMRFNLDHLCMATPRPHQIAGVSGFGWLPTLKLISDYTSMYSIVLVLQ